MKKLKLTSHIIIVIVIVIAVAIIAVIAMTNYTSPSQENFQETVTTESNGLSE